MLVVKINMCFPFWFHILINGLKLKLGHGLEWQILEDMKTDDLTVNLFRVVQLDYF